MARFLAHTDDPLGLATAGDIILTSKTSGVRRSFVEAAAETGKYKQDAVTTVRPFTEYTLEYTLRSSNLVLPFGAAVGGTGDVNYFIFSASVTQSPEAHVKVSVVARKYTSAAMFDATNSPDVTVTVTGGFGVQDVQGFTLTGCPQVSNYTVGGEETGTLHATSGDFCTGGILLHRLKKTITVETTGTVSASPSGFNATQPLDVRGDNSGELHISSAQGFIYLDPAA
jgi:hypothetical protein